MASFTRDEAILALDVLYSAGGKKVAANSEEMVDLSALLRRLPIHAQENRRADFRCNTGIAHQLSSFRTSCNTGKKDPHVGKIFFEVAFEFENRRDELHAIAASIRNNEPYFSSLYGGLTEDDGFPEGVLLGHLHRTIEKREGEKAMLADHCEICQLKPELCYQPCGQILQNHLLVSPVNMNGRKKYGADSFITVCPNCHEALHRYRPWITRDTCGELLR